jgi:hypothetical protein
MEPVESIKAGNLTLNIYYDEEPLDPRKEFDNLGTMICFHKRYKLGDEHNINLNNYSFWDDLEEDLRDEHGAVIILPLYLLDHSGLTMSTCDFGDPWDSGQVGFIYTTADKIKKAFDEDNWREISDLIITILNSEVETYSHYINGSVYCYTIEDEDGNTLHSCCNFYGYDFYKNGLYDSIPNEFTELKVKI